MQFTAKICKFAVCGKQITKTAKKSRKRQKNHENGKKAKYGVIRENTGHDDVFLWLKYGFFASIMGFFGSKKRPIFWVKIMDLIRQNMGHGGILPDFLKISDFQRKQQKIEIAENIVICRN